MIFKKSLDVLSKSCGKFGEIWDEKFDFCSDLHGVLKLILLLSTANFLDGITGLTTDQRNKD